VRVLPRVQQLTGRAGDVWLMAGRTLHRRSDGRPLGLVNTLAALAGLPPRLRATARPREHAFGVFRMAPLVCISRQPHP
jgi:hypothetical protein